MSSEKRRQECWVLWNLAKRRANLKDEGGDRNLQRKTGSGSEWVRRTEQGGAQSSGASRRMCGPPDGRRSCDGVMEWWRRWSEWKTVRGREWERGIEWETRWKGGGVKLDGKKSSCARLFSQRWHAARTEIERREEPARLWCLPAFSSSNWIRARTASKGWGGGVNWKERWLSLKLLSSYHKPMNI